MIIFIKYISEIIGYIDGIESSQFVGNNNQYKIFKFYINNGNGRRVQIIAWNDDIDNVEPLIKTNYVSAIIYKILIYK